jgi:hypothetical protein
MTARPPQIDRQSAETGNEAIQRLETTLAENWRHFSASEKSEIQEEIGKLCHQAERQSRNGSVFLDAIKYSWGKSRISKLIEALFPKKRGGHEGTKFPKTYFDELDRRCSRDSEKSEQKTTVAREILERNNKPAGKDRVDYLVRCWKKRNRMADI